MFVEEFLKMEETMMGKMKTKLVTLGFRRDNNTIKL
jgi:hypothetical protein